MSIVGRDDFTVHETFGFNRSSNDGYLEGSRSAFVIVPDLDRDAVLSFLVELFEELFIRDSIHRNGDRFLSEREGFFKDLSEVIARLVGVENNRILRGRKGRIKSRSYQKK